jgi:hypothetical protein
MSVTASKSAARRMYSPIAVRAILTDRSVDNLSAGIGFPLRIAKKDRAQLRLPTALPASPFQQGGRIASESVAAFDRNGWPLSVGMGGRIASDSAG